VVRRPDDSVFDPESDPESDPVFDPESDPVFDPEFDPESDCVQPLPDIFSFPVDPAIRDCSLACIRVEYPVRRATTLAQ